MARMEFVITNGTKFIRKNLDGKYEQTKNLSLADIYGTKKIAMNVMLNSIPKILSRSYYVAEVKNGALIQSCATRPPKSIQATGDYAFTYKSVNENNNWYHKFLGVSDIFATAMSRNYEISQELSDIESMITDLEHYIEFNSLNAREGYKAYKKLHSLLQQRRVIKNEQKVVMAINKHCGVAEEIKQIENVIKTGTGNEYKPRILVDLFAGGIDSICYTEVENNERKNNQSIGCL